MNSEYTGPEDESIERVSSKYTNITERMLESDVAPNDSSDERDANLARLMLSYILSDTSNLTSQTTSSRDKAAAAKLAGIICPEMPTDEVYVSLYGEEKSLGKRRNSDVSHPERTPRDQPYRSPDLSVQEIKIRREVMDELATLCPQSPENWLQAVASNLDIKKAPEFLDLLNTFKDCGLLPSSIENLADNLWQGLERFLTRPNIAPDIPALPPVVQQQLQNRHLPVSPMKRVIRQCREAFYRYKNIFSPYLAVVQSSGMGKTTCLYEVAQWYKHSAYILLNSEPSKLWPSEMTEHDREQSVAAKEAFLEAARLAAKQTKSEDALSHMTNGVKKLLQASTQSVGLSNIKTVRKRKESDGSVTDIALLILDEASTLCRIVCQYLVTNESGKREPNRNAFELFRKALSIHCKNNRDLNFVVIVADTTSHVGNFAPTLQKMSRHARTGPDSSNLFPVVNLPMYFDALVSKDTNPSKSNSLSNGELSPEHSFLRSSLLRRFGRPLWNLTNVVDELFVGMKLCEKLPTKEHQNLALLGCRVSMQVVQSSLASDLVANSTAVCTFVNKERDVIECQYLSEPLVSEVSAIHSSSHSLWPAFREVVFRRHIDAGRLGELVAQKVLLDVYDQCVRDILRDARSTLPSRLSYIYHRSPESKIPSIALLALFKHLVGPSEYEYVKKSLQTVGQSGAHVFFNHFVTLQTTITFDLARQAMGRCCALMLRENTTGADLCIPAFDPTTEKLSLMVWVQVKNRIPSKMCDQSRQTRWWNKLQPHDIMGDTMIKMEESDCALPSLSVMFSVNPNHATPMSPDQAKINIPSRWTMAPLFTSEELQNKKKKYHSSKRRVLDWWT